MKKKPSIKPLNISMYRDDRDSVNSNLLEIEEKINEIIEFLDQEYEKKEEHE